MSVEALTWAFARQDLNSGAKLLLVAIANRAEKNGICFAGREALATDCCYRAETVTQNMKLLEGAEQLERFDRRRQNGSRTSDWLVLAPRAEDRSPMIDADPDEYPSEVAQAGAKSSGEKSSGDETSGEDRPPGHLRISGGPEPSVEPPASEPLSSSTSSAGDEDGSDGSSGAGHGLSSDHVSGTSWELRAKQLMDRRREMASFATILLGEVAVAKGQRGTQPSQEMVLAVIEQRPGANIMQALGELEDWALHGGGAGQTIQSWPRLLRRFLKAAELEPHYSPLLEPELGTDWAKWVEQMLPYSATSQHFAAAVVRAQMMAWRGHLPTVEGVTEHVEARYGPWEKAA